MDTKQYLDHKYFKLLAVIKDEYEFAKFNRHIYAVNCANFDDKKEQENYLLWSAGRLEGMEKLMEKIKAIGTTEEGA